MKASLRSFSRYVPAGIVRTLLARGEEARLGGEMRSITIQFSDVAKFTELSERLTPSQVVEDLAAYLECMSDTIGEHGGTVDKFIGDGVMAIWNAPNEVANHATMACLSALRAQERLRAMRSRREAAGRAPLSARIGLHTGEAIVGNFGTADRFAYTAIGDSVNLASRLEQVNKQYGTEIIASAAVRDAAGAGFEWRRLDRVTVTGRREPTEIFELLGQRGAVVPARLQGRDIYEAALTAYLAGRFDEALAGFAAAARADAGNHAAEVMARRIIDKVGSYPADHWRDLLGQGGRGGSAKATYGSR